MPRRRRPRRSGALTELPPLRILAQIAALQGIYYAAALVLMLFTALVAGTGFQPGLVLGWEDVRGDNTQGWLFAFVWLLDGGFFLPVAIVLLIGRSKLVLDFALTTHFVHLLVATLYSGRVPRHAMWWAAMAGSSALAVALGTWGCRYRELRPISFGGNGGGGANRNAEGSNDSGGAADSAGDAHDGDEEQGYARGRGRGRGRDGAGAYEMVGLKKDDDR